MAERKLFIGFDGTWNDPNQRDGDVVAPTNVVRFQQALKYLSGKQVQYYEEGVGTRDGERLTGGALGVGVDDRVIGAYRFLSKRFNDDDYSRDENTVFIFGFSRGSFTARRLAGLIHFCGIPVDPNDCEKGLGNYTVQNGISAEELKGKGEFFDITIEAVGVWDTVKETLDADLFDQVLPGNVLKGYHAMAIDERRANFPVLKWDPDPDDPDRILQVWFAGVHSDVGGGYADCKLADVPLRWLINRFLQHKVAFKADYVNATIDPTPTAEMHNSYKGIWIPLGTSERVVEADDYIHQAVKERMADEDSHYAPTNVPAAVKVWSEPS